MDFKVRPVRCDDAPHIAAIYRPIVEQTTISFEETAPDAAEFARRIASISRSHPWLVAETDGRVVGYAYASSHRERSAYRFSVDVSVYVEQNSRGHRAGTSLYEALFARLRELGFHRAFAGIALPNDASLGFHERFGFEPVGVYKEVGRKFGRWLDVYWCQRSV